MQSCLDIIPSTTGRVLVAYSGGLDSSVLLHLAVARKSDFEVIPWHINHGLLDVAADMERFSVEQARTYGLEARVDRLDLADRDSNIEAEARQQRYQLFEQHAREGDCILTAHHADDQAETFLLNALRGSGSAGLRGIARQRRLGKAWLMRPLLQFSRARLESYAADNEIPWYNDPSNRQIRFDRNFLRNEVSPILRKRWPNFQDSLLAASDLQSEIQSLLDEVGEEDLVRLRRETQDGYATLDLDGLLELSDGRRHNLIRHWIAEAGLSGLPQARLLELDRQLHARPDAMPEVAMHDYSVRIYDRRLFLVSNDAQREYNGEHHFGLAAEIEIEPLDLRMKRSAILSLIDVADRDQPLTLKFYGEGQAGEDRHRLKRLFQQHRVPPWRRAAVPRVYLDGKLAGILP